MNRLDFLKLASVVPASFFLPRTTFENDENIPNILILIFDAWSAANTSLYGYPRKTTPNIDRWAENAIVYHNHYASGHYTYSSTASLLTGVLPWTHKGYWGNPKESILEEFNAKNVFSLPDSHHRSAYTNNLLVSDILGRMSSSLDLLLPKNN